MRKRKGSKINIKHFFTQQVGRLQNSLLQEIEVEILATLKKGLYTGLDNKNNLCQVVLADTLQRCSIYRMVYTACTNHCLVGSVGSHAHLPVCHVEQTTCGRDVMDLEHLWSDTAWKHLPYLFRKGKDFCCADGDSYCQCFSGHNSCRQ